MLGAIAALKIAFNAAIRLEVHRNVNAENLRALRSGPVEAAAAAAAAAAAVAAVFVLLFSLNFSNRRHSELQRRAAAATHRPDRRCHDQSHEKRRNQNQRQS